MAFYFFLPSAFQQERNRCRCDCTSQRISHECRAVHETTSLAAANYVGHRCAGDGCRQCHVTSRQCLADTHDVRFHSGPFPGKKASGPSKPRCDFIKDQQYLILVAQFACRCQECGGIEIHAACSLNDGFEDQGCYFSCMLLQQVFLKVRSPFRPISPRI